MARQGLMDDSGYDFFDVSDCSNYESCREDAYNDGYEKGRVDAIDEFLQKLKAKNYKNWNYGTYEIMKEIAENLKEQKK